MNTPFISIVVLAYNQFAQTTLPCLQSLAPWFADAELEFIVLDNASPDGSGALARAWCEQHPKLRFVQSESNLGYAGGMNAAAELASGHWLFLVNNDTEFPAHALDALKKVLSAAPEKLAMIGPVTNSAGNGQRLYDPDKSKTDWLELGAWLNIHPCGVLLPTYRCDFFCIAIRRSVWKALNGLDPVFGRGYYEDFDFSLRLRDAGHDQAITEDVFVYHQGSATFSLGPDMKSLIKTNKTLMQQRHRKVRFLHVRQCNLEALKQLLRASQHQASDEISQRIEWRQLALTFDLPKSPVKRWLWKQKTKRYLSAVII